MRWRNEVEMEKVRIGGRFAGCVPGRKFAWGRAEAHLRSEVRGRPRRAWRYTDYSHVGIPRRMSRNTETDAVVYRGDRVGIPRSAWRHTEIGCPQARYSPLFVAREFNGRGGLRVARLCRPAASIRVRCPGNLNGRGGLCVARLCRSAASIRVRCFGESNLREAT